MASPAQITANQANAQKSTGPATSQGKARSARNSTRHGLTSRDLLIPEALRSEFEALREDLKDDLNPETPLQMVFFNQALSAAWKLFRCDRAEAQLDTMVSRPGLEPLLDPALEPTLRTIDRARAQAAKLLAAAVAELRKVQTENQYRWAAMPESEGYDTNGLGVADWQTINARLQNEAKSKSRNAVEDYIFGAMPPMPSGAAATPGSIDPSLSATLDRLIGNRAARPLPAQSEQTNPIACAA